MEHQGTGGERLLSFIHSRNAFTGHIKSSVAKMSMMTPVESLLLLMFQVHPDGLYGSVGHFNITQCDVSDKEGVQWIVLVGLLGQQLVDMESTGPG